MPRTRYERYKHLWKAYSGSRVEHFVNGKYCLRTLKLQTLMDTFEISFFLLIYSSLSDYNWYHHWAPHSFFFYETSTTLSTSQAWVLEFLVVLKKKSVLLPSPKEVPISAARSPLPDSCQRKGSPNQSIVSLYIEASGEFPSQFLILFGLVCVQD
jgi:hypothetical protein